MTPLPSKPAETAVPGRIVSMDQFRGYSVAGMFAVNFLGGLAAIHPVLKHHNTYFSYADSIMPSFLFAVGFSYRLTILRHLSQQGAKPTYCSYVRRSLSLVLVSLAMYGFGRGFSAWRQLTAEGVWEFVARLLKADLWEVLAIIGVTQVFIMPFVAARTAVRVSAMAGCLLVHVLLSYWFNFDFVYGRPNWFDAWWGAAGTRAWDGGLFGIMSWAVVMLAGTLAYDIVSSVRPARSAWRLFACGVLLMAVGYALSCLTTLYNVPPAAPAEGSLAVEPVWPPLENISGRHLSSLLAEPPLVPPPPPSVRPQNYWMMGKRVVSASFIVFASGVAFALYALFVAVCDLGGCTIGLFRTFGQNALAAYLIHHMVDASVRSLVPDDSPLWYCLVGFTVFFAVTYLFVRHLEKHGLYLRL